MYKQFKINLCSNTICVNDKLRKEITKNNYKVGEEFITEIDSKVSHSDFPLIYLSEVKWSLNSYIIATLEGTKCGENAVCLSFFDIFIKLMSVILK